VCRWCRCGVGIAGTEKYARVSQPSTHGTARHGNEAWEALEAREVPHHTTAHTHTHTHTAVQVYFRDYIHFIYTASTHPCARVHERTRRKTNKRAHRKEPNRCGDVERGDGLDLAVDACRLAPRLQAAPVELFALTPVLRAEQGAGPRGRIEFKVHGSGGGGAKVVEDGKPARMGRGRRKREREWSLARRHRISNVWPLCSVCVAGAPDGQSNFLV